MVFKVLSDYNWKKRSMPHSIHLLIQINSVSGKIKISILLTIFFFIKQVNKSQNYEKKKILKLLIYLVYT